MTTARYSHSCQVRLYVILVTQALFGARPGKLSHQCRGIPLGDQPRQGRRHYPPGRVGIHATEASRRRALSEHPRDVPAACVTCGQPPLNRKHLRSRNRARHDR